MSLWNGWLLRHTFIAKHFYHTSLLTVNDTSHSLKQVLRKASIIKNQKDTDHTKAERNILESVKVGSCIYFGGKEFY